MQPVQQTRTEIGAISGTSLVQGIIVAVIAGLITHAIVTRLGR